jgi:Tfp pilus assembly protein PilF
MRSAILAAILWITPVALAAQDTNRAALAQIQRLRDAGDFAGAVELLRNQLAQHPDDAEAAATLAQTLYWLKDISGSRTAYEAALARHPESTTLRLEYGRMLVETGDHGRALELLTPLLEIRSARAEAATLLGTLSYWEGDLSVARRRFEEALRANPSQPEAARQLNEILAETAPWVRISSSFWHDNQPLVRSTFGVEAGWFATPLTQVIARMEPRWYSLNDTTRPVESAEFAVARYEPRARMESEVSLGGVHRGQISRAWDWTGQASVGFRLPKHLKIQALVGRTPYFSTKASLDTTVMVQTAASSVHWETGRGWVGEASYQYHWYPDNNAVRNAYGWMLAPIVHRNHVDVQAGYAFAFSNAVASRFVLGAPKQAVAPGDPRFNAAGRYAPYYTPDHSITHSVLGGFGLGRARKSFRLDASYGVRATDNAPFLYVSGTQVVRGVYARTFSPWNVRTSFKIPLGENLTFEPNAEVGRTIFYSWASAGVHFTYRFAR